MHKDDLHLEVRTRRTLRADWTETEASLVDCPVTGSSRTIDACRECGRGAGIVKDSTGHWFVVCRAEAPASTLPSALTVDPDWAFLRVTDAMSGSPICVHRDLSVSQLVALMVEQSISGAPVVDDAGYPVGIVSRADVLMDQYERNAGERESPESKAHEIMTPLTVSIPERASLLEAVRLLNEKQVHRLPVVDDAGAVVGLLSTLDVLRAIGQRTHPR